RITRERRGASRPPAAVRTSTVEAATERLTKPTAGRPGTPRLWWKRPFDLAICIPILLVCLPVIGILALLVGLDSPGPAFFRQERVGRHGARFRMWKLRTMFAGCSDDHHRQAATDWFAGQPSDDQYKTLDDTQF